MNRRRALELLGGATLVGFSGPLGLLGGCARQGAPGEAVGTARLPLAELPEGERVRILVGEDPVELLRTGGEVRARLLWCSHMGCEVRWDGAEEVYRCPCHEGVYDARGRVLAGPPPAPLRLLPARIEGSDVVVRVTAGGRGAA